MKRAEVWAALYKAGDAVQAAVDAYELEGTPQARDAMRTASRDYVTRLIPVIGTARAAAYGSSVTADADATDRLEAFQMKVSALPSMDNADRTLLDTLNREQADAETALNDARVNLNAVLESTYREDCIP